MTTLNKMSYDISCDHIKQLNEKYNNENDRIFKEKFLCFIDEENINKDIRYLNNIYVSRKSCIYKSTEPDEFKWANAYVNNNIIKNNYNPKINTIFNENTRSKISTKY